MRVFRDDDGKLLVHTRKCPKGLKGIITICMAGMTPDNLIEVAVGVNKLKKLERVDPYTLSEEWRAYLGIEEEEEETEPATPGWRDEFKEHMDKIWTDPIVSLVCFPITVPLSAFLCLIWGVCWICEKIENGGCGVMVTREKPVVQTLDL